MSPSHIHVWRWRAVTAWIVIFTIVVIWAMRDDRLQSRQGREAHQTLCVFKQDLRNRLVLAEEFLRTHSNGFPSFPVEAIQADINSRKATLASLHISC